MANQTTATEQWERLLQIICDDQATDERIRAKVLSFGKEIGLEQPDQLFQIRDQQALITWPLALQIHKAHLSVDPYWLMGLKKPSKVDTLIGAWSLHDVWEFRNGLFELEHRYLGSFEEYLFREDGTVVIVSRESKRIENYSFDRNTRHLQIGKGHCYISKLDKNKLEIIYENQLKEIFNRIPDGQLHIIPEQNGKSMLNGLLQKYWLIDREYDRSSENDEWALSNNHKNNLLFWKFESEFRGLKIRELGHVTRTVGVRQLAPNILRILINMNLDYNGLIELDGNNSFWLYVLPNDSATHKQSLKKYHFSLLEPEELRGIDRHLFWIESNPIHSMNIDKLPIEYVELWNKAATETESLFDTPDFLERTEKYNDEKYAGAYAFAHVYITHSRHRKNAETAATLYRQFLHIISMWLKLREKGVIITLISPFTFSRHAEFINRLQAEVDRLEEQEAN